MATMECDMCDEENATYILTNLVDGAVAKIGVNCFPMFIMSIAEGMVEAARPDDNDSDPPQPEPVTDPEETPSPLPPDQVEPDTFTDPKPSGRSRPKSDPASTSKVSEVEPSTANDDHAIATS